MTGFLLGVIGFLLILCSVLTILLLALLDAWRQETADLLKHLTEERRNSSRLAHDNAVMRAELELRDAAAAPAEDVEQTLEGIAEATEWVAQTLTDIQNAAPADFGTPKDN